MKNNEEKYEVMKQWNENNDNEEIMTNWNEMIMMIMRKW